MLGKPLRRFICGESHIVTFKHPELHHRNGSCGVVETTTPVPFLHFSMFHKQYASLYVLAIIFQ